MGVAVQALWIKRGRKGYEPQFSPGALVCHRVSPIARPSRRRCQDRSCCGSSRARGPATWRGCDSRGRRRCRWAQAAAGPTAPARPPRSPCASTASGPSPPSAAPSACLGDLRRLVYDEPDEHGFWGRRLEAYFSVQGDTPHEEKSAHDHVRAYFIEVMDGRQFKIYSVDV